GLSQETKMGQQLAEANIRRQSPNFGQYRQRFPLRFRVHGSKSPILGSPANALGRLPITSTRITLPGASLAIRVALVTPLYSTSTPSDPSYTQGGGIPTREAPNKAICRCSFAGSAPCRREGGTRNWQGSTSRKSAMG